MLLLMEAWRRPSCSRPDNDVMLARLASLSEDLWASVRDTIMLFWKLDGRSKTWTQKRLSAQRDFSRTRSESQRDKAVKRWNTGTTDDGAAVPDACPADAPYPHP
jgi:uncharacterized protein YdaU (DUF1376 family)